ncbi:MAG TPA: NAD(+) synthase [Solirubrobacterales bacterium]|nr:NAD(+) synthase [Solirubrobacterales bacterium]
MAEQSLRIALAQINPTVGDIEGNAARITEAIGAARADGAQLVVLPELAIPGYPPEDLLLKRHFLDANRRALEEIAAEVDEIVALVGFAAVDGFVHNALGVLADGEVKATYTKMLLPNYGVFDERRYFEPGPSPALIEVGGRVVGLTICEDIWFPGPPAAAEALAGAGLIVNASASPYHRGKGMQREREIVAARAREVGAAIALCNAVGGQDELIFDGHSVVVDDEGETVARAAAFEEELLVCDVEQPPSGAERRPAEVPAGMDATIIAAADVPEPEGSKPGRLPEPLAEDAEVYEALKLGLRDYVEKNGFEHAVLALSGGIDSSLVALVASDALGPERVTCVVMPSPYSSERTQADARKTAANLGVELIEVPIEPAMRAYADLLQDAFEDSPQSPARAPAPAGSPNPAPGEATAPDHVEENIQARIRGNLVMALSNRFGWLVLTTGNKSELSVGYATLYGDMAGGFAVIKDCFKTLVYRLVRYRNGLEERELVPDSVLERPPSAELRPDQLDEDSLPPYEVLDGILEAYVERDQGADEIVAAGHPQAVVDEVITMVDRAEYKRRQAPPGIKITPKAFGRDRRLPITNRYRG